jgi:hypothetical protein
LRFSRSQGQKRPRGNFNLRAIRPLMKRNEPGLGQRVVIEVGLGAASGIAAESIAHAPPDGSNVTDAVITSHNLRFNFSKDSAPITPPPLTALPLRVSSAAG